MTKRWYVVNTFSGLELKVKEALLYRIKVSQMEDKFGEIMVPTEEVIEIRSGQKCKGTRKFFPGYLLINMDMDEASWYLVRNTPKVIRFIGGTSDQPTPITDAEANVILQRMREGVDNPQPKVLFEVGEVVRVTEGPFADFDGSVEEVNYDKQRLRVAVLIFGRATPVDLDFNQVEKS